MRFEGKKCVVVGGCGFIGSHVVDQLIKEGAEVLVYDDFSCSNTEMNPKATLWNCDIRKIGNLMFAFEGVTHVFNFAAIARTPWCIKDPLLCYEVNVMGTLNVLEAARRRGVGRVVVSSSNVVYAFDTPYRTSKEAVERLADVYNKMYNQSVVALRYSNVYGKRQLETGESPNVFAALRKSKRENGHLKITGDGTQSRDYTHVSDIVDGNLKAALSDYKGVIDLCTGINTPLNEVAEFFKCPVEYIPDRPGDILHIRQNPQPAKEYLGWEAKVPLSEGIKDCLNEPQLV